ncbi:MCE family protein [[Mycobacterium] wendilense]|uniref:MCE family protein n=1 Tax=[Mycobacterium] wendilense TaxID=3064284 RepID=A0ABN9P2C7_9MYCO|nr:MCE family protein [Mycolicibacterium sp. MU0050]CAJ1585493.1 MCE family protein [Mycolicibacterium sp. MU0050]
MFLVKLIDLFVGAVLFLLKKDRGHNPTIPFTLGAIGTIGLVVLMLVTIGLPRVFYQARTEPFTAEMANASGLTSGDPVYVAGVPAGRVERVNLAGDRVRVDFRLDDGQPLGNQTTATVRLRTVLGKRFLDVMPAGVVDPQDGNLIPLARTTVPYSLDEVGREAEDAAAGLDQQALTAAMRTVHESIPSDNADLSAALAGISSASAVFAESGDKFDQLLRISRSLSELLVEQNESVANTAANAAHIVSALTARRDALGQIVTNLSALVRELSAVYGAKQEEFSEVITKLTGITATLRDNAEHIDATLRTLPPAMRAVTNATGNGNWADVNSPSLVMPDNLLCALNIQRSCR